MGLPIGPAVARVVQRPQRRAGSWAGEAGECLRFGRTCIRDWRPSSPARSGWHLTPAPPLAVAGALALTPYAHFAVTYFQHRQPDRSALHAHRPDRYWYLQSGLDQDPVGPLKPLRVGGNAGAVGSATQLVPQPSGFRVYFDGRTL